MRQSAGRLRAAAPGCQAAKAITAEPTSHIEASAPPGS
jgi:hypothetical protein